ncbi:MAG: M14 family zinc carboxypeptidase [Turneriella sp.]|nr:M14 family zinc carboxypeptidase [Turneriella sp.]
MDTTKAILRFDRWERRIIRIVRRFQDFIRIRQLDFSSTTLDGLRFPIYLLEIGKKKAFGRDTVTLVSGVHGLETIAIRIHLDILRSMLDPHNPLFSPALFSGKLAIYSIPILNPAGVALQTRANARGVDLNRNSGIEAEKAVPFFGGQSLSPKLPYFRGKTLQRETRALYRFLREQLWPISGIHTVLDLHSGYGRQSYLWWPYSFSNRRVPNAAVFGQIGADLAEKYPSYRIGPMASSYQTHGDLWDRALLDFEKAKAESRVAKENLFLPLTLEIGTWEEIRKNPLRLVKKQKIFNPPQQNRKMYIREHRQILYDIVHLHVRKQDRQRYLALRDQANTQPALF